MKKKKKENNTQIIDIEKIINDRVEQELLKIEGYFNQEYLLKSEGIVFRNEDNLFYNLVLEDKILQTISGLFDYEGLPNNFNGFYIEKLLFKNGVIAFFEIANKYYVATFSTDGLRDWKGEPLEVIPRFENGREVSKKSVDIDTILIKNTETGKSTIFTITPFLKRLTLLFEASMQTLKASMTKWLVTADVKDLPQVRRELQKMLDKNGFFAFSSTSLKGIEKLEFFEEFKSSEYWEDYNNTLAQMYALLGIKSNTNEDKKERLIVDEVNINNQKVNLILDSMFKARQEAIEKINIMFNLNIKVKLKVNPEIEETEVKENEENIN